MFGLDLTCNRTLNKSMLFPQWWELFLELTTCPFGHNWVFANEVTGGGSLDSLRLREGLALPERRWEISSPPHSQPLERQGQLEMEFNHVVSGLTNRACDMKPHLKTLETEIRRSFLPGEHIDVHQVRWHLTCEDRARRLCPQTFPVCRFSLALLELIVLYNKTLSLVHLVSSMSDSSKLLKLKGGSGN